jgi:hypothetical protein
MATPSTIAVQHNDGTISQIYCHWNGYITGNGIMLQENYRELTDVEKLVRLGDLSQLEETIEPAGEHSFDDPMPDVCVYYGRDRGETNVEPRVYRNFGHYEKSAMQEEFNYLFKDNRWYVDGELLKGVIKQIREC